MKLTRREFIFTAGRLGAVLPFLFSPSACAPVFPVVNQDTGLSLGYVSGDITPDGAVIWLRSVPGSMVNVQYSKDPSLTQFVATEPLVIGQDSDGTAHIQIDRLDPGTFYYYRAAVANKKPGPIARFLTAPKPDDNAVVKFCFSADSRQSYQPFTIMDAINANQPNFFVHLGDTIYADRGGTATELADFWDKYRANRDAPSQRLFSDTDVYVIWDDHEVRNDYEGSPPIAVVGRRAFFDYWPVRRNPQEKNRLYRSFRWGKALDLFLLDARQYRDHAHRKMLGRPQKEWLFNGLASSSALFKVIATSVPMIGGGRDRWDGYPEERLELIHWITQKKITGVIFISGDLHYAAVSKVHGLTGARQIVAGPMAAPMNVLANGNSKRFEFFSNRTFNFGMITIDPASSTPQMMVELRDEANRLLYRTPINCI